MATVPDALVPIFNRDKVRSERDDETRTFEAQCHCKNIQFSITLPRSMLPLNAYICGCSICRLSHGTFGSFHITLPLGHGPLWTNGKINLSVYRTPGGNGQRFFCPTCGAHSGHFEPWIGQWVLETSMFKEQFWEFTHFAFPGAARDGGMLSWLPEIGGKQLVPLSPGEDTPPTYELETGANGEERLRAECHCGGVSFTIGRPSKGVFEDDYARQYVSPKDPKKWKAVADFCRDCRVLSGAHFVAWVFVPRTAIEPEMPPDLRMGTMKTYESSEGTTRGFCGVCGATICAQSQLRARAGHDSVMNVACDSNISRVLWIQ